MREHDRDRGTATRPSRQPAPYNRHMPMQPTITNPQALALARKASSFEARGAWLDAIDAWAEVIALAPDFVPGRLALAQAYLRCDRPEEALPWLEEVTAASPAFAPAWLALGVAQSMLGRHVAAVASVERAVSLAPQVAAIHAGLGDVLWQAQRAEEAGRAFGRAVELAPRDADALNKLGTFERRMARREVARGLFERAVSAVPRHPYARVNLGTLAFELRRFDEGRSLLERALAEGGLAPDAKREAEDACAAAAERVAMREPLRAALDAGNPGPIAVALRTLEPQTAIHRELIDDFAAIAGRLARTPGSALPFPTGTPSSSAWNAIEAHHNFRLPLTDEAIEASISLVERPDRATSPDQLDVVHYANAVAGPGHEWLDADDPVAFEAWLRWRHAQIVRHRPLDEPGHTKVINNVVSEAKEIPRTPPGEFRATLRTLLVDLMPQIREAPARIAFLYMAAIELHPFSDANGRTMRLMLNRLLVRAGLFPHLRHRGSDGEVFNVARRSRDITPLIEWLAEGSRYAAELDRRWTARPPR